MHFEGSKLGAPTHVLNWENWSQKKSLQVHLKQLEYGKKVLYNYCAPMIFLEYLLLLNYPLN